MTNTFSIWIDADAFPNSAKDIVYRAAERTKTAVTLVANKPLRTPPSPLITSVLVPQGDDVADHYIVEHMKTNDLVITADIPLAAEVLDHNCQALNPRGQLYTRENIADRLSMRDFMDNLRANGLETGGPPPLNKKDLQTFANALDRILTRCHKK
jgi:uncharacterized protein